MDRGNGRVGVIYPNGRIGTVAGGGPTTWHAPQTVSHPYLHTIEPPLAHELAITGGNDVVVLEGGDIYLSQSAGGAEYVLHVRTDGLVWLVAGHVGTIESASGDGGAAYGAPLAAPDQLAVGPDGSLYIDTVVEPFGVSRRGIRRVRQGIIDTVIGARLLGCGDQHCGEGGPAVSAHVNYVSGVAVGPVAGRREASETELRADLSATCGVV